KTSRLDKPKGLGLFAASPSRHRDDFEHEDEHGEGNQDDSSSISFAQSGCHSILSAWRIKAANRAARLASTSSRASSQPQALAERPVSVLSNGSSQGRKSVASTAFTGRSLRGLPIGAGGQVARIPLGPKSAQHFVTNTRRRRRANELILSTLEARRRAVSLNRANLGSLFGSESYLGGTPIGGEQ
ncbi:Hypothetical predicted protein, partial [Olea europaea subsp. europaea]